MKGHRSFCFIVMFVLGIFLASNAMAASTLRVAHNFPVKHPYSLACEMLAKNVKKNTNGEVIFKHYPAGQLGKSREITDQLIKGTVDLQPAGPTAMGRYYDPLNSLQVYYLVDSPQQLLKIMRGPIGQKLFEQLRQKLGVRVMDVLYYGRRHVLTTKKPIYKPADLNGLKLRSMTTPFLKMSLEAMGPTGVPVSLSEVYTSLQTGVVDGMENTPVTIRLNKYYEVAKYYSLTGHSVHPSLWNFNDNSWQKKIPDNLKPVVEETIQKVTEWEIEEMLNREKAALKFLKENGVEIIEVDREPFKKAVQAIYPELEKRFGPIFTEIAQAAAKGQ